jgi:drug/metabolite transporter (DMT)-like permease
MVKKELTVVYAALLTAVLFWGSSFVAVKIVLQSIPPSAYMFLRFAAASLIFIIILNKKGLKKLTRKNHLSLAAIAFFEPGLYFIFETAGIQRTSASSASIIIAAVPAVVALSAAVFLNEKISLKSGVGIVLSISGVFLLTLFERGSGGSSSTLTGNLFVFLAVLSAAAYMIIVRKVAPGLTTLQITGWQIIYGTIFFLPFFIKDFANIPWNSISSDSLSALIFLILFATIIAFMSYNFALTKIPASKAALFINGIPVVTVIVSAIVLGERISLIQIMGGLIIISGVTLANIEKQH